MPTARRSDIHTSFSEQEVALDRDFSSCARALELPISESDYQNRMTVVRHLAQISEFSKLFYLSARPSIHVG